ncbi:hypothetical protein E5K25_001791, partial [Enterococcus faecalis]|nr:hypothetical protein [Enterococcus faecalis]
MEENMGGKKYTENELREIESELGEFFFKQFLSHLVYSGKVDNEKIDDLNYVDKIVEEQLSEGLQGLFNVSITFEKYFEKAIKSEKEKSRNQTAIILCGTLIEHKFNSFYTEILSQCHDFEEDYIFQVLNSTNIKGKMTWLFLLSTGNKFDDNLRVKIEKINLLRNKFVHYKPIFEDIDEMKKADRLKNQVNEIASDLEKIPKELSEFLQIIEKKLIPEKEQAEKL